MGYGSLSNDALCQSGAANDQGWPGETVGRLRRLADDLSRSDSPYEWHLGARLLAILEREPTPARAVIAHALSVTDLRWFERQAQLYTELLDGVARDGSALAMEQAALLRAMAHDARHTEWLLRDLLEVGDGRAAA